MESRDPIIGTLNEGSLHAALKAHYAVEGDRFEVPLEGFVIDIMRGSTLIEIQTGSFGAMGAKLDALLDRFDVLLVHPVAHRTTLVRPGVRPRRSPVRGSLYSLFDELVSVPTLIDHPRLTLDVVLVDVEKVQGWDARARRGRGGYRTLDRRLTHVVATHRFASVADLAGLLPDSLPARFTTADLAEHAGVPRESARKAAYCFRPLGLVAEIGRSRSGILYERTNSSPST